MLSIAFAQGVQQQASRTQQSPIMGLLPIALIFIIFYFLLIRPQKKAQKNQAMMRDSLKKNDEVITSGGIHGTIVNIQNDVVTLRIDDNTRIKVQKGSISSQKRAKTEEKG